MACKARDFVGDVLIGEGVVRIAVTGRAGQLVTSLSERAADIDVVALGRPELDLQERQSVLNALVGAKADVIINAAAYTAVDKAETEPDVAMRVNADGAAFVAEAAASLGVPLLHVSTDYVFEGTLDRPYREDDPTGPTGAYGRSKLSGEERIAAIHPDHAILRTAWVYSPFGVNFVRTMLRLGESRSEVGVVADQWGNPTSALDIADALIDIAKKLAIDPDPALRGVFHLSGQGDATWADVAAAAFEAAAQYGRPAVRVRPITTADYPTPARRPANSRLDNTKLKQRFGLSLPHWRPSLTSCVERILGSKT